MALAVGATVAVGGTCDCPGDCDADCTISASDFSRVVSAVFAPVAAAQCPVSDANGDGRVSAADITVVHLARARPPIGCAAEPTATATELPTVTRTPTTPLPPTATPSPTVAATPVSRWIPLPPLPLGGRQEVGVAHLDGRVYVIGGFAPMPSARVEAYDIAAGEWVEIAPLPVAGHHIGAAAAGGHVYAVGGLRALTFTPTSDVFRYDADRDVWEPVASLPSARGALAVAEVDGRIHAVGGIGAGGGAVADHAAYLPDEDRWVDLAPYPIAREHIAGAAVDGVLFVVGGRSPLTTAAHRWDHESGNWHELPPMPTRRAGHAAAALDGRLVTFGGEGNNQNSRGIFPEVEVYDPATDRWTRLANMRAPRHGIGAATVGDRIYVPGGADVQAFGAVATHDALEIDF